MAKIEIKTGQGKSFTFKCRDVLGTNGILCTHKTDGSSQTWTLSHKPSGRAIKTTLKTQMEAEYLGRWFWSELPESAKIKFDSSDAQIVGESIPKWLIKQINMD